MTEPGDRPETGEEHQAFTAEEPTAPPAEEGAPTWTVTFGDMMSLLLTFFILLFSMSELEVEKFLLASQSLREAMGGTSTEDVLDPAGLMPDSVDPELYLESGGNPESSLANATSGLQGEILEEFADSYLEVIQERLQKFVEENQLEETVRVDKEEEGVFLRMETGALFGSGEAGIKTEGREALRYLSEITRELNVGVVVAGHADNQPIRSPTYASNWELSAARAAGVARYLVQDGHPATMVRVESYGEFKPIADNSTPEGRARNRRVELFYSREDIRSAAIQWSTSEN
jgi:chemotaxis protein MotB